MNHGLSDDELTLVDAARRFVDRSLAPAIRPFVDAHAFPTDLVRSFGAAGFMGTAYLPEDHGSGLGLSGAALLTEVLAEAEPGFAAIYLCNSAVMTVLARHASAALREEWLAPLCAGSMIGSFGVTEPHGGSDVASITMRAVERYDHFELTGSKIFSTNAGTPLHGLSTIVAVTDPELGPRGLSTFVVPVGTPGFSVGKAARKIGWRVAPSAELHLDGCRIPKRWLVGNRGEGLKQILGTLGSGRVLVAAAALGLSRKALELAIAYGGGRIVGGRAILEHQGIGFPLADIATGIHAASLMVRDAAARIDRGVPSRTQTSMAKLFATDLAMKASVSAVQVHGAYGVHEEYEVSGLIGEAKVLQILEGTNEIQRTIIARELSDPSKRGNFVLNKYI